MKCLPCVDTGDNNMLRQAVVPIVNWDTCKQLNANMQRSLTSYMLCAGELDGSRDACQGDSGGPLVCKQHDHWWQYGIVNWGLGCGRRNHPGVYADVVMFLPWIYNNTDSQLILYIISRSHESPYWCIFFVAFPANWGGVGLAYCKCNTASGRALSIAN